MKLIQCAILCFLKDGQVAWLAKDQQTFTTHRDARWAGPFQDAEAWVSQAHRDIEDTPGAWPEVSYFDTHLYFQEVPT